MPWLSRAGSSSQLAEHGVAVEAVHGQAVAREHAQVYWRSGRSSYRGVGEQRASTRAPLPMAPARVEAEHRQVGGAAPGSSRRRS